MGTIRVQLVVTELEDGSTIGETRVDESIEFVEIARNRLRVQPGAAAVDISSMFTQLGTSAEAKGIFVKSSQDGVVLNVTTTTGETAVIPCYPGAYMGQKEGFNVGGVFKMEVELPSGDMTAVVEVVAYG